MLKRHTVKLYCLNIVNLFKSYVCGPAWCLSLSLWLIVVDVNLYIVNKYIQLDSFTKILKNTLDEHSFAIDMYYIECYYSLCIFAKQYYKEQWSRDICFAACAIYLDMSFSIVYIFQSLIGSEIRFFCCHCDGQRNLFFICTLLF